MKIFNMSMKQIATNPKSYIILTGISLAIFLVSYLTYINNLSKYGKSVQEYVITNKPYISKFVATVKSNKNTNTYTIEEWSKNGKNKMIYTTTRGSKVSMIAKEDSVYIQNEKEYSTFHIHNYINEENNLLSFKTIINLQNELMSNIVNCSCKLNQFEQQDTLVIFLNAGSMLNDNCSLCKLRKAIDIGSIKIVMNKKTNTPIIYVVYDINEQEKICVVFDSFEYVEDIQDEVFM